MTSDRSVSGRTGAAIAALLLAVATGCGGGDAPDAKNLVLITLDTTRQDALGAFGGAPNVTPHLDALAEESTLYLSARTVAPLTLPSHASMLTGLYPPRHTVRDNSLTPVPRTAVTLAEKARTAGMRTGAVVAAAVLASPYGLDQGFEHYDEPAREAGDHSYAARDADEITRRAKDWLATVTDDERFVLWAHYFDPHKPLDAGPEYRQRVGGDPYLACVARMDDGVGELLDALRARPDWDDTLVIVVADHGEANGEHGERTHSAFVYDSTILVPMMVRLPPRMEAHGRLSVESAASVTDVFPTAVDFLRLGSAGDVDGVSLRHAPAADRGVYFESYYGRIYYGWSPLVGWADADAKYVHSSQPEFFDVATDPGELSNVIDRSDATPYLAALARLSERPSLDPASETVDPEILEALQGMGYAGAGMAGELPGPLELEADRPSPHTRPIDLMTLQDAWSGDPARRAALVGQLAELLERDPNNHWAWARYARLLHLSDDLAGAVAAYERVQELSTPWPEEAFRLADCYLEQDRKADAAAMFERGLELGSNDTRVMQKLLLLYQELGRVEDAARIFAKIEASRL